MWCVIDRDFGTYISEHKTYSEAEQAKKEYEEKAEPHQRFAITYVDGSFGV